MVVQKKNCFGLTLGEAIFSFSSSSSCKLLASDWTRFLLASKQVIIKTLGFFNTISGEISNC